MSRTYDYFKEKVEAGLIGPPCDYTIATNDSVLSRATSNPVDYELLHESRRWRCQDE